MTGVKIIQPVPPSTGGGEFGEQILADLISEGYSGQDLLDEFNTRQAKVRPAVEAFLEVAKAAAHGTALCIFQAAAPFRPSASTAGGGSDAGRSTPPEKSRPHDSGKTTAPHRPHRRMRMRCTDNFPTSEHPDHTCHPHIGRHASVRKAGNASGKSPRRAPPS